MGLIEHILEQPTVTSVGWMLVHSVWQGILVACILAVALRRMHNHSADSRYAVTCAAMVMVVALPVATLFVIRVDPSGATSVLQGSPSSHIEVSGAHGPTHSPFAGPHAHQQDMRAVGSSSEARLPTYSLGTSLARIAEHWQEGVLIAIGTWLPWMTLGWFAGVTVFTARLLRNAIGLGHLRRQCQHCRCAQRYQRFVDRLSKRMGLVRPIRLLESTWTRSPITLGWLRPMILLPATAITGLTPEQLEAILAHELAHIRRYDYLVNLFQAVIETLLFYHPAVWYVSHRVRIEREHCCDDLAVRACGSRLVYIRALTWLEESLGSKTQLALAADGGSLVCRVRRLAGPEFHYQRCRLTSVSMALMFILVAAAALAAHASGLMLLGTGQLPVRPVQRFEAVAMTWVTVADAENEGELSGEGAGGFGPSRVCGAVGYNYQIAANEVTAGQYCAFLNAVARNDRYGLYNELMWTDDLGCGIERAGQPGDYAYSVSPNYAHRPVSFVSWGDAARFCNWLTNGQPEGPQEAATTEDGSYTLNGATSLGELSAIVRNPYARYVIPTEDEWYKAAYYDATKADFRDYAWQSGSVPGHPASDQDSGQGANYLIEPEDDHVNGAYSATQVGIFSSSPSAYGTFDQNGNVWEWNETVVEDMTRGLRGGAFNTTLTHLRAAHRGSLLATDMHAHVGFRVARVGG